VFVVSYKLTSDQHGYRNTGILHGYGYGYGYGYVSLDPAEYPYPPYGYGGLERARVCSMKETTSVHERHTISTRGVHASCRDSTQVVCVTELAQVCTTNDMASVHKGHTIST
jgi:hypothetical protein